MAQAEVFSGICGFTTKIIIDLLYEQNEAMQITSDCKYIDELAKNLRGEDLINIATKEMMGKSSFSMCTDTSTSGLPCTSGHNQVCGGSTWDSPSKRCIYKD
jgi:hypothetical protein